LRRPAQPDGGGKRQYVGDGAEDVAYQWLVPLPCHLLSVQYGNEDNGTPKKKAGHYEGRLNRDAV
jgi:hypothetical protein